MPDPAASPPRHAILFQCWRASRRMMLLVVIAFFGFCLMLSFLENRMLYFPMRHPEGEWSAGKGIVEEVDFSAADGTKLHGWYLHVHRPRAVALFSHGNAGNITHRLDHAVRLQRKLDVAVLVYDYRGYGKSAGRPCESGILEDARAARGWLARRAGVTEPDVVLLGESLGGGVAVDLAARDGARGLILEKTFTSLPDVAAHHYWFLPVRWLMRNRLDSLAKIGGYAGPLIQCHGDNDEVIPFTLGQQLFAAAPGPKRFVELPGDFHNDPLPTAWFDALDAWLDELPPVAPAAPE